MQAEQSALFSGTRDLLLQERIPPAVVSVYRDAEIATFAGLQAFAEVQRLG
ncbi:hypothetical protein D3C81_2202360 [compost metagenome]